MGAFALYARYALANFHKNAVFLFKCYLTAGILLPVVFLPLLSVICGVFINWCKASGSTARWSSSALFFGTGFTSKSARTFSPVTVFFTESANASPVF
jgi:hypothetical protein